MGVDKLLIKFRHADIGLGLHTTRGNLEKTSVHDELLSMVSENVDNLLPFLLEEVISR